MKKSKKKKEKKNFLWDVFPCRFPISDDKKGGKSKWFFFQRTFSLAVLLFPVIKRGKKVSGFVFFRKGRGKV